MNENIQHEFFIWDEKNLIEHQKNCENKSVSETKDTTSDTQTKSMPIKWQNITNPKERRKAYKKAYYEVNKDKSKIVRKNYYEINKQTINDKQKAYYKVNKDKISSYQKTYREDNKDKIKLRKKAYNKTYYKNNEDKAKAYQKTYFEANKDKLKIVMKNYREINKQILIDKQKAYNKLNKDKIKAYKKDYNQVNKDKIRLKQKDYVNNRFKTNVQFKLTCNLRARLKLAINNNQKTGSAVRDLGCSIEQLKQHLESKFQTGMSWDNWSFDGWHIDHIKPLASFDLTDRKQFLEACHYTNLQPLWAKDNLAKSDKITNE